jgi:hypothetical protein
MTYSALKTKRQGTNQEILFHLENRVCLSRGVQVTGLAWRAAMRIVAGLGELVQRTGDG